MRWVRRWSSARRVRSTRSTTWWAGGRSGLRAGQWTDDTSMALCLATSLLESGGFDPVDQMGRYLRWFRQGYLSSTGECFDIGGTTREALVRFERTGEPYSGPTDAMSAGNGSLMRLAPVPMFFAGDAREAIDRSADSSRTTHGAVEAVDACRYFAGLLVGALRGVDKQTLLSDSLQPGRGPVGRGSASAEDRRHRGGVVQAQAAPRDPRNRLRGGHSGGGPVGLLPHGGLQGGRPQGGQPRPDDADTTGAIFGQIAGAHYGVESIPTEWRQRLTMSTEIVSMADRLHDQTLQA